MKFVLVLVVALATLSVAALPPPVPSAESGALSAYLEAHGKPMFERFARIRLRNVHPGGSAAVRDETVETTAKTMFTRAAAMAAAEKHKYLTGIHDRLAKEME